MVLHLDFQTVTRTAHTPPDMVMTENESSDMVKGCSIYINKVQTTNLEHWLVLVRVYMFKKYLDYTI